MLSHVFHLAAGPVRADSKKILSHKGMYLLYHVCQFFLRERKKGSEIGKKPENFRQTA